MICGSGINLWRKVRYNNMHQTEKGGKLANVATTATLILFFVIHFVNTQFRPGNNDKYFIIIFFIFIFNLILFYLFIWAYYFIFLSIIIAPFLFYVSHSTLIKKEKTTKTKKKGKRERKR